MTREEAIEIVKKHGISADGTKFESALRELIPELAESEDERIMSRIIDGFKNFSRSASKWNNIPVEEVIAYLEKQKEPHYTKRNALFDKCVENCDPEVMKEVSDNVDKMEEELTEFELRVHDLMLASIGKNPKNITNEEITAWSDELLALAKKELLSYADESNPAIEAMADLERTYFCNPDKLPKWLKDEIAKKELNAHTKGYYEGYKVAEKRYNESVTYHFPIMPTPPSGWGCDGTHCTNPHGDCINCPKPFTSGGTITTPNTASGTSTLKAEG